MTLLVKAVYAIAVGLAILLIGLAVAYWRAGQIPNRPKDIAANAVFLWAPHLGVPGPRRGWWLSCWYDAGGDHCRLSNVQGITEYEGEFVLDSDKGSVPSDQLIIDVDETSDNKVWVGSALVPLVFLRNGKVLIPASRYEEGMRLLKQVRPATP